MPWVSRPPALCMLGQTPLMRYVQFAKQHNIPPFPMRETVVYSFLKDTDTAPNVSKIIHYISCICQARPWIAAHGRGLELKRVKGHAAIHFTKKRKTRTETCADGGTNRTPGEMCLNEERTMYDRIASGFFLLLVFGRLRFSDGQSISSMELEIPLGADRGHLECTAERCKTSTSLEKRTRFCRWLCPP